MKFTKLAVGVLAAVTLFGASSATYAKEGGTWTLDYRHRYEDISEFNYDRICVIGAFDNGISFYIDSAFKSGSSGAERTNDPDQWGDFTTNSTEMNFDWTYKVEGTGFSVRPGIIIESTEATMGYKPFVRLAYNWDNGLWTAVRLRYDYWRNDNTTQDQTAGRVDWWLGYNVAGWDFSYNFTYYHSFDEYNGSSAPTDYGYKEGDGRIFQDNNEYGFEHEFTVGYKIGNWRPYIQIANLAAPSTRGQFTDDRQTRYAVGVQYTF